MRREGALLETVKIFVIKESEKPRPNPRYPCRKLLCIQNAGKTHPSGHCLATDPCLSPSFSLLFISSPARLAFALCWCEYTHRWRREIFSWLSWSACLPLICPHSSLLASLFPLPLLPPASPSPGREGACAAGGTGLR